MELIVLTEVLNVLWYSMVAMLSVSALCVVLMIALLLSDVFRNTILAVLKTFSLINRKLQL